MIQTALIALALLSAAEPETKIITGKVTKITDGDTLTVLDAAKVQHKIRLEGIDCPERKQAFTSKCKQALSEKVFGKDIQVQWRKLDQYGRVLGHIYLDGRWINQEMVTDGWAWHFVRYNDDSRLADAEQDAREKRLGIWSDIYPVIAPWDYRKQERAIRQEKKRLTKEVQQ